MSYYTGSVNDYQALRTVIQDACVTNGWTLANGILSKGSLFVRLDASVATSGNAGVTAVIGTGASGATLQGSPGSGARLGRPSGSGNFSNVTWPATYHVFVFDNPAEVYVILNFNIVNHYWMAFGSSDVPGLGGTGNWFAGCATINYDADGGYYIQPSDGLCSHRWSSGPFWYYQAESTPSSTSHGIHTNFDGVAWTVGKGGDNIGACNAVQALNGLPTGPNPWNEEAPLLPIKVFVKRPSNKVSLALQMRGARFVRIDNYQPGQVVTLGADQWMVFPFGVKNAAVRNGGQGINHTGTFGWALRCS